MTTLTQYYKCYIKHEKKRSHLLPLKRRRLYLKELLTMKYLERLFPCETEQRHQHDTGKAHLWSTLGELPNVSLVFYDEVNPRRRVHHCSDAADAGELQESICNARASAPGETVQGLQEEIQPA